ncbi:MAG: energy transducer TonB [Vampirovibrio sp.]|jgi:protein TonB|nr:energy transducer TonB [Vampirovibrio sp.]
MSADAAICTSLPKQRHHSNRSNTGRKQPLVLFGVIAAHLTLLGLVMTFSSQHDSLQPKEKPAKSLDVVRVQIVREPVNASIVSSPQAGVIPMSAQDKPAETPKPASAETEKPQPALQRASQSPTPKAQPIALSHSTPTALPNATINLSPTVSERGITEPTAPSTASKTGNTEGNTTAASSGKTAAPSQGGAAQTGAFSPPRFGVAYLHNPAPQYPSIAKRMGEEGQVLLKVLVSPEGGAQEVRVHKSSGSETLDKAALKAVRKWRFVPAKMGEAALAAWVQVPIVFKLSQGE